MIRGFRNQVRPLVSSASYYSLQTSGLKWERETRTQETIFPGFDHLVVPNIYTCSPQPGQDAVDMHDAEWITDQLKHHGHIILKNTGVKEPKDFKRWSQLFWKKSYNYDGGQVDREDIGGGVLNVNTFEPAVMDLVPHNEMSYQNFFPERLAFCCFQ